MKTLLRIDASIRIKGSHTRELTDYFQARWLRANPGGRVMRRCMARDPVPHLSSEALEAFQQEGQAGKTALSDTLVEELKRADHILIGSPLYNLTLPSALKAYFDHVGRAGATFEVHRGGYRGLLQDKRATVITARGGVNSAHYVDDFQTAYLRAILAFIGVYTVDLVSLEGTALSTAAAETASLRARRQVDDLFDAAGSPVGRIFP